MRSLSLLLMMILAFLNVLNAQVKTNFNNREPILAGGKFLKSFRAKNPYVIPARDIKALIEKEVLENTPGEGKPFRIAEPVKVDIDVTREAVWTEDNGYAYGKFSIRAAGAKSISVNFDRFHLPAGTELYVYSENGEMITGPVTENENNENGFWGSWVYKGGLLTVDLKTPAESKADLRLHIASVAYGYKDLYVSNFGASSGCNVNVLCPEGIGWDEQRNSVALILNGSSSAICSGALINNTCNFEIPYFLTANHCFDGSVANWKFTFQAWSWSCNPSQNGSGITLNGSALRARSATSDFCLVELSQMPPANSGITFSGWSRMNVASPSGASISHPQGDVMKIALYNTPITQLGNSWIADWASGTVEPGSSGAPLYDNNRRIVGHLQGGNPSDICTPNDHAFYGRFAISWAGDGTNTSRLSDWLDPAGTGAVTTDARGISSIFGPAPVCTDGWFVLQNQTAGTSVAWTSSNPSAMSIDPASGYALRQGSASAPVTVTANVVSPGCPAAIYSYAVPVGTPVVDAVSFSNTVNYEGYFCSNERANIFTINSIYDSPWQARLLDWSGSVIHTSPSSYNGSGPFTWTYLASPNPYVMELRASNACGTGDWQPFYVEYASCSEPFFFSVYPNPASKEFTIDFSDHQLHGGELNETYTVRLINDGQGEVFSHTGKQRVVTIPTSSLPVGVYYLGVRIGDRDFQKRLIVKR